MLVSFRNPLRSFIRWFDARADEPDASKDGVRELELLRILPFLGVHLACFLALFTGVSVFALCVMLFMYAFRVLGITVGYHRYFAHRAFRTSRPMQFFLALMGASAVQRGPLWWAAHHRHHHRTSDTPQDAHSPVQSGFWWSHLLWFQASGNYRSRLENMKDFADYPELYLLDRYDTLWPIISFVLLFCLGSWVGSTWPSTGTSGFQVLVWGGFISTVLAYHATFSINSLVHMYGAKRYATGDESRNNRWLWPITFGENWHNNHHMFPASARLGFYAREIDIGWYFICLLRRLGLIWDVNVVSDDVREHGSRLRPRLTGAAAQNK